MHQTNHSCVFLYLILGQSIFHSNERKFGGKK